jgi:hypothetical protein
MRSQHATLFQQHRPNLVRACCIGVGGTFGFDVEPVFGSPSGSGDLDHAQSIRICDQLPKGSVVQRESHAFDRQESGCH